MRTEKERSHLFYTSGRVTVIYLCMDHSWPGTRPAPSIRRRLSPSRCCAGSSPDAAAENLQTEENRKRKVSKIYHTAKPKFNQNKLYDLFSCNHRQKKPKKNMLWSRRPTTQIQITDYFISSRFLLRNDSLTHRVPHFSLPSNHFDWLPGSSLKQTTHQQTTNHYCSHAGCCTRVQSVAVRTQPKHNSNRGGGESCSHRHSGGASRFLPSKFPPGIYVDVQPETNRKTGGRSTLPTVATGGKQVSRTRTDNTQRHFTWFPRKN